MFSYPARCHPKCNCRSLEKRHCLLERHGRLQLQSDSGSAVPTQIGNQSVRPSISTADQRRDCLGRSGSECDVHFLLHWGCAFGSGLLGSNPSFLHGRETERMLGWGHRFCKSPLPFRPSFLHSRIGLITFLCRSQPSHSPSPPALSPSSSTRS